MNKRRLFFIPLLLILSLLAVGCSDDDGEKPSRGDETEEPNQDTVSPSGLSVGDPAPRFSMPSASGENVSLVDYQGQAVLLYFHMAVG